MSSDDDDFISYTPLQRSQVPNRESKPDVKSSKLSLSFRKSQNTDKKIKAKTTSKIKSTPSKKTSTPSKIKTIPSKVKVKKGTPIKSRADHPEENCSASDLSRWYFLYGSDFKEDDKSQLLKRKNDSGGESSASQHKKKNSSEVCMPQSAINKQDEVSCLRCMFPFNTIKEKSLHSFLCGSKDISNLPRCPSGNSCWETKEQHFWKFSHDENSLNTKLLGSDVRTNTFKDLVRTDPNRCFTNESGHNSIDGPSTSGIPSMAAALDESLDIIVLSDLEESTPCHDFESKPLFELTESENHEAPTDEKCEINASHESSNLLDLEPDIELFEDDQTTVCFDDPNPRHSPSFVEEDGQVNQKSPLNCIKDQSSGSETPDLLKNGETGADELGDPEGDELIASMAEEAIVQFAMPTMEKVMKWRKDCREAQSNIPAGQRNSPSPSLRRSHKTVVQPICFHLHYHEASPAPSTSKENGQTSILTYFKPTKSKEESCPCGEKKTVPRQENVAAWQGLMERMQKKKLVSLPSVSENSSSEERSGGGTKQKWGRKGALEAKPCPFYKYIPDTNFVVDAFSYGTVDGVSAYFLSHFHYDHYCGLRKNFNQPIYCSEITARLVNKRLGVPLQYLHPLPMWKSQQVCGVEVTLLGANHCPGAVMFLFKVKPGVTHLHVGDFRAHPSMERYPALQCPINILFLDTTYCSPEHVFPTQEKMIEKCVSLAQDHHQRNDKTLFVVGSYTIGKEKVFKAIASSLNCSIWVRAYKKQVLNCINDKEIQARLTDSRTTAKVHVLPMSEVKGEKLKDYLNELRTFFSEIVGMCPTGWEFTSGRGLDDITSHHPYPDVYVYGIPYSEHSSFSELKRFVQFIKPRKIIPTVNNGNQTSRKQMEQHFRDWQITRQLFS